MARTRWATLWTFLILLALAAPAAPVAADGKAVKIPAPVLREARALWAVEKEYYQARERSDWKAIYARQHPRFRRTISFVEFVNRDGRVAFREHKSPSAHVSGASVEPADIQTKPFTRRDPLGFPSPRTYRIVPNPWVTIRNHAVKTVAISHDGRYARVTVELQVREQLDPTLFKVYQVIDRTETLTDYWEKVDGRWVVPLMVHNVSVSGGPVVNYLSPNNLDRLNTMKFYEIPAARLAPATNARPRKEPS